MEPADRDSRPAWRLIETEGLVVASCGLLEGVSGIGHAFSTRRHRSDGQDGTDFDLGTGLVASAGTNEQRRRLCRLAGLGDRLPVAIRQVHGDELLHIPAGAAGESGEPPPAADGVVALRQDASGQIAAVRTADCVPVLLADHEAGAVAAIHAGWRGTASGIVRKGVERLEKLGFEPGRLLAAIGPAIGPCCYVVGEDVAEAVSRATPSPSETFLGQRDGGEPTLDLSEALSRQLRAAGLDPASISRAPWCTSCRADLFFSHRRDGERAGRMMAVIGWIPALP